MLPVMYLLTATTENVYGIWNTVASGSSVAATSGDGSGPGTYIANEGPSMTLDRNFNTKYTSDGSCNYFMSNLSCGINTGVYFTPIRGPSLLRSLRFYTANDYPARDPVTVTVEGSNQTSSPALTSGSSWTLIYNGSSGLNVDPGRQAYGITEYFSNSDWYRSYRLLITSKRGTDAYVQYSEVDFIGY